ncbi:MAG: nucleoside deaminase [Oscillospiraceae bacterium]|jgi:tRNA(adenine34) deaminase|nr:nucleoside deaminase [Oscillospiraceae bacterium]
MTAENEKYMAEALALARDAARDGETPVGCVIADADGKIIGRGRNRREKNRNATAHAEIEAIGDAGRTLGGWRLGGCALYVTLEPCPMCAGAIINARISKVFYGAREPATGACGSVVNLFMEYPGTTAVTGGVLEKECRETLEKFFFSLRQGGCEIFE